MSQNIQIGNPFVKQFYHCFASDGRAVTNPLSGVDLDVPVPSPYRRINLIIQNQGDTDVIVSLSLTGSPALGDAGIKLYSKQSITLDNYNGAITVYDSTGTNNTVSISESFA